MSKGKSNALPEFPIRLLATIKSGSLEKGKLYALLSEQKLKDEMEQAVHLTRRHAEKYLKANVRVDEFLVFGGSIEVSATLLASLKDAKDADAFTRDFAGNLEKVRRAFEAMLYASNTKIPEPTVYATINGVIPADFATPRKKSAPTWNDLRPYSMALGALLVAGFAYLVLTFSQVRSGRLHASGPYDSDAREYERLISEETRCGAYESILLRDGTEILIPAECPGTYR